MNFLHLVYEELYISEREMLDIQGRALSYHLCSLNFHLTTSAPV